MAATLAACHAVFHPGRDGGASGRGEPASGRSAGAVGGLACAPPRVGALYPTGSRFPCFPRSSRNKATHAPSGGGLS